MSTRSGFTIGGRTFVAERPLNQVLEVLYLAGATSTTVTITGEEARQVYQSLILYRRTAASPLKTGARRRMVDIFDKDTGFLDGPA